MGEIAKQIIGKAFAFPGNLTISKSFTDKINYIKMWVNIKKRVVYLTIAIVLFLVEFWIERNFQQGFIRYYLGDYLVAILLYTLFMCICLPRYFPAAMAVLFACYVTEAFQWMDILSMLHIKKTRVTNILLGSTFSWTDILCYTMGVLTVFFVEFRLDKSDHDKNLKFKDVV